MQRRVAFLMGVIAIALGRVVMVGMRRTRIDALLTELPWQRLWIAYRSHFIDHNGRVIDYSADDGFSTSEGQAYALFFSLIANDRELFQLILAWTNNNLAAGELGARLPVWKWGKGVDAWGPLDSNSASDADSWIAYALVCAGQRWGDAKLSEMGTRLAELIIAEETVVTDNLRVLLPGAHRFPRHPPLVVNPSYTPLFLAHGLANATQNAGWREIALSTPELIAAVTRHGFAPDWAWWPHQPKVPEASMPVTGVGSYDAIRTYLWAGMTPLGIPGAKKILSSLHGMSLQNVPPPERVDLTTLRVTGNGGPGFSGALLPYLDQLHHETALYRQLTYIHEALSTQFLLPGQKVYYPENLILFGLGAISGQIQFSADGMLRA
jgi:endoglucanase